MSITVELHLRVSEKAWNGRVDSVPEGNFYQTTDASRMYERGKFYRPLYWLARDVDGSVVGQAIVLNEGLSNYFWLKRSWTAWSVPLMERLFPCYTVLYGPLIFDLSLEEEVLNAFLDTVDGHLASQGGIMVRRLISPQCLAPQQRQQRDTILRSRGYEPNQWGTFVVDLRPGKESLWQSLEKKTRYDVRKAKKDGVVVCEATTPEDWRAYLAMREDATRRGKSYPLPGGETTLRALHENDKGHVFLAKHEGRPVAGILVISFNRRLTLHAPVNTDFAIERKLFGMHLLMWHTITWGCDRGMEAFDLAGVKPRAETRSKEEEGIYKFKARWGGQLVEYPIYSKVFPSWKSRIIVRTIRALRR